MGDKEKHRERVLLRNSSRIFQRFSRIVFCCSPAACEHAKSNQCMHMHPGLCTIICTPAHSPCVSTRKGMQNMETGAKKAERGERTSESCIGVVVCPS